MILVPGIAQAHSASTFNVIIKQNDLQPGTTQIEYNDSIMWYNADSRENVTQRIVFDADGDGLYNGSADWDSGEIYQECTPPSNNSSSDCKESFTVWFNGTWGVGEYNYQVISSNGDVQNGTITVIEHIEEVTGPAIGSSFGSFDNQDTSNDDDNDDDGKKQLLLLLAATSALGSIMLIVLLVKKS
ncbi:MAG: hypothetical protein VYA95_00060 [Candidatus Thermoplasmatota archaeon]|nr:hypothetical protein [Candidatus Thermoplasmatota archaeon]